MSSSSCPANPFPPQGADHRRRLGSGRPESRAFHLVLVYRGLHCPVAEAI
ncbi:MAG: hypothetical protein R3F40_18535 [Candidatus Competibacteraceae bacterium]